jgi:NAD(P)-dependent dehydrogenase (short-subunit alcohol dehydrogenase family)
MSGRLAGRRCLVTAAAQGIGRETAVAFANEGAQVIATDINAAALEPMQGVAGVETHILDVTNSAAIAAMISTQSAVDVLFNCAGYVHQGNILECADEDWQWSFRINVDSMYNLRWAGSEPPQRSPTWRSIWPAKSLRSRQGRFTSLTAVGRSDEQVHSFGLPAMRLFERHAGPRVQPHENGDNARSRRKNRGFPASFSPGGPATSGLIRIRTM